MNPLNCFLTEQAAHFWKNALAGIDDRGILVRTWYALVRRGTQWYALKRKSEMKCAEIYEPEQRIGCFLKCCRQFSHFSSYHFENLKSKIMTTVSDREYVFIKDAAALCRNTHCEGFSYTLK